MANLFLGLDSSTQSLSAVVIDYDRRKVVYEYSLSFDKALPQYRTRNGVLPHRDPLVKHSPPLMWVEALDLLLSRMRRDGVRLGDVQAISGSGQQHGSVYLNHRAADALADASSPPAQRLKRALSRKTSPIWMDSSTAAECEEIRSKLGGVAATARKTGSDAFERFTGPQIRKFFKTDPDAYAATTHIALVSSFMASVLAGRIAPIDHGDGAGMNLMDIRKRVWHPEALKATAPNLKRKLPPLAASRRMVGAISPYFAKRYGVNPEARVQVWSGDNPCSVIGLGLIQPGNVAISLGTSDTYFGTMKRCRTDAHGEGHVFGSPTGDYMTLICFKNGSLAREKIREMHGIRTWDAFGKALASTPPGNRGAILLPWFEAEIVPRVNRPGIHRFDLDPDDAAAHCRAIAEAQMMSMRLHSAWMGVSPDRIYATGGASNNVPLLQVMADVMQCPVLRIEVSKSAALGAALRAAHGWLAETRGKADWRDVVKGFTDPVRGSEIRPRARYARVYDRLIEKYARCEREALEKVGER
ncbi:MAG TPA: carbohydrate kinase [Verrucomicrobia bacterium]|nr:carbohydrate kinase [Verrucomicrobiota bacterium]HOP96965.1 FGGY-family carbohydrate kinase [Verrucomicrobiota bacterium]HPU56206.1 FGGY-family carbohydrate kinase [Verrucomicrobiota bacterium]